MALPNDITRLQRLVTDKLWLAEAHKIPGQGDPGGRGPTANFAIYVSDLLRCSPSKNMGTFGAEDELECSFGDNWAIMTRAWSIASL
jgi:hypothetical protein